ELKLGHVPDSIVRAMQAIEGDARPGAAAASGPASPTASSPSSAPPAGRAASASAAPAPAPSSIQEPTVVGELFGVSTSGGLMPLERVTMRSQKASTQSGSRPRGDAFFFEGSSSPVAIRDSDPQAFVIRMMGPIDKAGRDATPQEVQRHLLI